MKNKLLTVSALLCCSLASLTGCKKKSQEHVLTLRNLYFSSWDGSDPYTDVIEQKFGVEIEPSSYSDTSWGEQVMGEVNGNNLGDVFHFDLESFNFGNTYLNWAEGGIIKALPDDLSKWPKINNLINNTTNINSLRINGKLYGLPLAYNQDDPVKDFSSFTYVYNRQWLKKINPSLVHADDTYTWEEFLAIIDAFASTTEVASGNAAAIGDVYWGFPSLTNFYKDSPHCYSIDGSGRVVNAFTTEAYQQGIKLTRDLVATGKYLDQVTNDVNHSLARDEFKGGRLGIYYENLSLSNYTTLRKDIKDVVSGISESDLDDRTAIMRVKDKDGNFRLEGTENWFSMTFFNADISDSKMERILDILDYLLGEEGTRLAIYGKKDVDYFFDENGDIELNPDSWAKKSDGEYATKINGAKFLREMITLNNDTSSYDPFTNQKAYQTIQKWNNEMKAAKAAGKLITFQEPAYVKWLSTTKKDLHTSALIEEGNAHALRFCFGKDGYSTLSDYVAKFNTAKWNETIAEINQVLGK